MAEVPDIVGHDRVRAQLADAVTRDRLHHALLFEGPVGVGKHTVATWLAMLANCEREERPCGVCGACSQIGAGNHPDVIEVGPDPARASPTIPVARVREVVRTTGFHRYSARRRFVIVDPAEAMAAPASNALLKTLEEPPEGTHFVLIANHASALLPTIVSRCLRSRFGPVPEAELAAWLSARGHDDAAELSRAAQGCPGRALSLSGGDQETRRELRGELLAALGGDLQGIYDLAESLTRGKRQDWTPRVDTALDLVEELLRDTVACSLGREDILHPDVRPVLDRWSLALWPGGVARCHRALDDARLDLAAFVNGKLTLEALLTRVATELGPARTAGRPT